jgi:hypothetical protein
MEQMIMSTLAIAALCWSIHLLRTGIAEPQGAPSPWAERTTGHRKASNRRFWP